MNKVLAIAIVVLYIAVFALCNEDYYYNSVSSYNSFQPVEDGYYDQTSEDAEEYEGGEAEDDEQVLSGPSLTSDVFGSTKGTIKRFDDASVVTGQIKYITV